MHEIKTHLETLTTLELIKMADTFGIDIPPDLERIFIIQELIEADEDFDFGEMQVVPTEHMSSIDAFEIASLPKQYNVNYLEILLRDPLWAFVYWEINALDRKSYESSPDFKGYFLHIIPLVSTEEYSAADAFTISVGNTDDSWRIYLSPDISLFQVNLCVSRKDSREIIISSKQINVPKVLDLPDDTLQGKSIYPILQLSGLEDFEILRNADKVPRSRHFSEA